MEGVGTTLSAVLVQVNRSVWIHDEVFTSSAAPRLWLDSGLFLGFVSWWACVDVA